jgi:RHS repeat-associated protein
MAVEGDGDYTTSYTYDVNNRLKTEVKDKIATVETAEYKYDKNGNQISKTTFTTGVSGGDEEVGVYLLGSNRPVPREDYTVEINKFDGFNRLVQVQNDEGTGVYLYKSDGLRLSKTVNDELTTHVYDGSNVVLEYGAVNDVYLRGINLIKSNVQGYYLFNAHGDVVQRADGGGIVTKAYVYDAFGVESGLDENDTNPFRYCAEYFDQETGSIYLRARYYDPSVGGFMSEDEYWKTHSIYEGNNNLMPSIGAILQKANLYAYCVNNPISFIDPNGLDMRIVVNTNSAEIWGGGPTMGHMGALVQNAEGQWWYFSAGENYVQFEQVGEDYLQDLEKFSQEYYGGYSSVGAYNESVYIKGDFTETFNYYSEYYEANKDDSNASSYDLLSNNCSHVVIRGFNEGAIGDGTNASLFIFQSEGKNFRHEAIPSWQIKDFQRIFFNNAFTYEDYHKQLNDQLWKYRSSPYFWERSRRGADLIEGII